MLKHHANTRKHSASDTRTVAASRDSTGETSGVRVSDRIKRRVSSQAQVADVTEQECTVCRKVFRPDDMSTHMRVHSEFRCETCGARFKQEDSLLRHRQQQHSKKVRFFCDFCKKSYLRRDRLQVHRNEHLYGHFDCALCQKGYNSKQGLIEHVRRMHTKREPAGKCSICEKEFATTRELVRHERRHSHCHQCKLCGKLIAKHGMKRHLAMHAAARPFKCTQCDKAYTTKNKLTEHIELKHSGRKMHECYVCGAGFTHKLMRDSHMLSHSTGKKLFDCETCGARFIYEANLRLHRQQQHS